MAVQGWKVTREKVREVIHLVSPEGVAHRTLKRHQPVPRTVYDVVVPNDLWHIDQNEKLMKKGGHIIFGIVDGATRRIVQMYVADHKKPHTVVRAFTGAVNRFGCPGRLRSDDGSENALVWRLMARLRGDESVLTGPSPANIKIEHQWYFTRWNVLEVYRDAYDTFMSFVNDLLRHSKASLSTLHPGADEYPTRLILIEYEQLVIQVPDVIEARAIVVLTTVALSTEA